MKMLRPGPLYSVFFGVHARGAPKLTLQVGGKISPYFSKILHFLKDFWFHFFSLTFHTETPPMKKKIS